ncbi:MAG: hypothetical protein J5785_06205 [Spirochaetales bacterium]|nr:hypothetical protein [Spirochaetales bacterium]
MIGIFISKQAQIGRNVTLFHHVTIGSNLIQGSKGYGAPVIGDDVFIGANSCIIGKVNIGKGARIGAGCCVSRNVPENSTVVSAEIRIISSSRTRRTE